MRATMSELLPAVNGTIRRIGRAGQSDWPQAGPQAAPTAAPAIKSPTAARFISWPSRDLLRFAQALDQRAAQQERPRELRVLGGAAQLVVVAPADGRVLLRQ